MILCCEICQQPIAEFNPEDIDEPITNEMFYPLDAERGTINPFSGQPLWFLFLCPICGYSPFPISDNGQTHPDRLFIGVGTDGERQYHVPIYHAPTQGEETPVKKYGCPYCDFTTDHAGAMNGHMRKHKDMINAD